MGDGITDLLESLSTTNKVARLGLNMFLNDCSFQTLICAKAYHYDQVPQCNVKEGDEIWLLLGCELPVILRLQPNGTYQIS